MVQGESDASGRIHAAGSITRLVAAGIVFVGVSHRVCVPPTVAAAVQTGVWLGGTPGDASLGKVVDSEPEVETGADVSPGVCADVVAPVRGMGKS